MVMRAHLPVVVPDPPPPVASTTSPRATSSGRTAEGTTDDELAARQRAISLHLAGRSVKYIYPVLDRVEAWFHK
jgi:hypothetical protein